MSSFIQIFLSNHTSRVFVDTTRMKKAICLLLFILFTLPVLPVMAQADVSYNAKDEFYQRMLQVAGISDNPASFSLRPVGGDAQFQANPWNHIYRNHNSYVHRFGDFGGIALFDPAWFQSYNTTLPRGGDDGAIWQGRGYNTAFSTGFKLETGPLHVQFRPVVGMAQNRPFTLAPYDPPRIRTGGVNYESSEFAYRDFRGGIDFVQRYGDDTFSWFDLGESSVDLRYKGIMVSLSNRKIFTGPAHNVSLQFGYNAPGFRHLYLGTYQPIKTVAGNFEFAYIFGGIKESDYFTVNRSIGMLSVNSLVAVYKPWFSDGLTIGAVRTYFHPYPDSFDQYRTQAKKLFEAGLRDALMDNGEPRGADPDNQLGSVFFRYVLADYGFEFYGEYGRNDHNGTWRDFRAQPNHHRAYTIGGTKTLSLPKDRLLAVNMEINQLEAMRTALSRGNRHLGGWYTHGSQVIGFAHNGQILGSAFGPGVNMQAVHAELFDRQGSLALKAARITYHNSRLDQYFEVVQEVNSAGTERWEARNIEFMVGAEVTAFLQYGLELSATLEQSFIMNHHYISGNDLGNTRLEIVLRKSISGWRR